MIDLDSDRISRPRQAKIPAAIVTVVFPFFFLYLRPLCMWFGFVREHVWDGTGGPENQGKEQHAQGNRGGREDENFRKDG